MRYILIAVATGLISTPYQAWAFSLNDCLLTGLKGVSSDTAARLVQKACEDKQREHHKNTISALKKKFGEEVDTKEISTSNRFKVESNDILSIEITNTLSFPERTLTYVTLLVATAAAKGQPCDTSKAKKHSYDLTLKRGSSVRLAFPSNAKWICTAIATARARPTIWNDFSISNPIEPLDHDPFAANTAPTSTYR